MLRTIDAFPLLSSCPVWYHGFMGRATPLESLHFFCWWYFVKYCSMIFGIALTLMIFWVHPSPWHSCFYQESSVYFSPKLITSFCFAVHLSSNFFLFLLSTVVKHLVQIVEVSGSWSVALICSLLAGSLWPAAFVSGYVFDSLFSTFDCVTVCSLGKLRSFWTKSEERF